MKKQIWVFILLSLWLINTFGADPSDKPAVTEAFSGSELQGYEDYPPAVKKLIKLASELSSKQLTYLYGSADPKNGGLDCSGTVYYLLQANQITDVPRQAEQIYRWAWQQGHFHAVNSSQLNSFEFSHLLPGDLLFWSGTYAVERDPPVTHVMIYLGKNKQNEPLMFGASDGRSYRGHAKYGVSVYDFKLPLPANKSRFLGYSCVPKLNCK
jgi:hypothetical protein